MNKKYFFLLIAVFIIAGGSLFGQNAQNLNLNTTVSGKLDYGSEVWYRISPSQTGFISVETFGETDTYIEFYDSNRKLLAEDDDSGEEFNACIFYYVTAGSSYLIKVRGYDSEETGPYQILAASIPTTELRVGGNSVSGTITEDGANWYSVRSTGGLLIVETTGNTDTLLEAYNGFNNFIGYDDDSGADYNARLEILTEANQTYLIILTAYESGRYQISAKSAALPALTALTMGREIPGNLAEGGSNWYSVRTTARGTLIVETTGDTDTFLDAYDSSYKFLTNDDDGGEGYNARIELSVEANQTYIFKLTGYDPSESGRYQIFARMR